LAKRILPDEAPKDPRGVNILGASALDGFDNAALYALETLRGGAGLNRTAVWGGRSSLEELKATGGAAVNWVVTAAALPLARYLRERYGLPFVAGLPIGIEEDARILAALDAAGGGDKSGDFPPGGEGGGEKTTLIIGEALFCSSFRAFLEAQSWAARPWAAQGGTVKIATFFPEGKELLRPGDAFLSSEDDAVRLLADPALTQVFADPLIQDLLPKNNTPRFTAIPHRAVSGRIYSASMTDFFGPNAAGAIKKNS
jgi:hypothetical protein